MSEPADLSELSQPTAASSRSSVCYLLSLTYGDRSYCQNYLTLNEAVDSAWIWHRGHSDYPYKDIFWTPLTQRWVASAGSLTVTNRVLVENPFRSRFSGTIFLVDLAATAP